MTEQLFAALSSNTVPFRPEGSSLIPVTDLFSFRFAVDEVFSSGGNLNVAYDDSLLLGIDERTLGLYAWDAQQKSWESMEGSLVSVESNVVSASIEVAGLFCVFATQASDDTTPPSRIGDLGAVPAPGVGAVEILWTAPGDDGVTGSAQQYVVADSDSLFGPDDWRELPKITPHMEPAPAGTDERTTRNLPAPGRLYYLAMRAKDEASNLNLISNVTYVVSGVADPNFVPAPATDVRAVDAPGDSGGAVLVTWQRSYDDGGGKETVTGYNIYRSVPGEEIPVLLASLPAGTTSFIDSTVAGGEVHADSASASDGDQETWSPQNLAFAAVNLGVPRADVRTTMRRTRRRVPS